MRRWWWLALVLVLLALLLLARSASAQVTVVDQMVARQKVAAGTTTPSASPLTVVGLPAASGAIVRIDAGGAVGTGPLVAADIPSVFTRRDVSESISGAWAFGSTLSIAGSLSDPDSALTIGDSLAVTGAAQVTADITGAANVLPSLTYSGNVGLINRKWLTVNAAELWVQSLVAQDVLSTIGGRVLVGPTTTLTRDAAPGDTTIYVKHNSLQLQTVGVTLGSTLMLETFEGGVAKFEAMAVENTTVPTATAQGDYAYTVMRNRDGSGANQWYAGDAAFDSGTGGSGFIDLYSVRGVANASQVGPTIVGNVRSSWNPYNAWAPRWALGNLIGLYGYAATTYGAAFGDPAATWIGVDATNGFRVMKASAQLAQWDTAGVITIGSAATNETGRIVIDSDSLDVQYRGSDGVLRTPFTVAPGGTSGIAAFSVPTDFTAGLSTPSVAWAAGSLTLSTSTSFSNVVLRTGSTGAVSGAVLPYFDAATPLGSATQRWNNIHLVLPVQTGYYGSYSSSATPAGGFPYVVVGDRSDASLSRLGYFCGVSLQFRFNVPNTYCAAPSMVDLTFQCGVVTNVTCVP